MENYASGDTLDVFSNLPNVVSVMTVGALDENGEAHVVLKANFSGRADLTVRIKGTNIQETIPVSVFSQAEQQTHDSCTVVLNRSQNSVFGYTISAEGSMLENMLVLAAAYNGASMMRIQVEEVTLTDGGSCQIDLDWTSLPMGTTVQIMVWDFNTLIPVSAPFVY